MTSRASVLELFKRGRPERIPFLPIVGGFGAKLMQVNFREMLTEPTLLTDTLEKCQRLFGYDGIVLPFDSSIEAEACGCEICWGEDYEPPTVCSHPLSQGLGVQELDISRIEEKARLPVVLEAAKRLKMVMGRDVALVAVINGPLTLAQQLKGEPFLQSAESDPQEVEAISSLAVKVVLDLCKAFCQLQVDLIVLAEEELFQFHPLYLEKFPYLLRPVLRVIQYYGLSPLFMTRVESPEEMEYAFGLNARGVILKGPYDLLDALELSQKYNLCIGLPLPLRLFSCPLEQIEREVKERLSISLGKRVFFTSDGEIPPHSPPEGIHEVMRLLSLTKGD